MGATLEDLDIPSADVVRIFKKWGWRVAATGTKQTTVEKVIDGTPRRLHVKLRRRKADPNAPFEAARLEGVTMEEWLKGPPDGLVKPDTLDNADIEYFLTHTTHTARIADGDDGARRYGHIRQTLSRQGLLKDYEKVKEQRIKDQREAAAAPPKVSVAADQPRDPLLEKVQKVPEPLPVHPDGEGYISLDEALALVKKKQNTYGRSACEVIAVLSLGDLHDVSGQVVSKLLKPRMKHDVAPAGMIRDLVEANVIWREVPPGGKRTRKMGLCVPVKLTDAEKLKYLAEEYVLSEGSSPAVRIPIPPEGAPERAVEEDADAALDPPTPSESVEYQRITGFEDEPEIDAFDPHVMEPPAELFLPTRPPTVMHSVTMEGEEFAVAVLRQKRDELYAQAKALDDAIMVLTLKNVPDLIKEGVTAS